MPPMRGPVNAKVMKTERTHEENQERAYIAASRRSDRSLEARIESARRASEIHKKRTGRGLRVTEQDVINEEMYEEEDDDLPSQYRRLQAHIASTADIFNGRLNSYLLGTMGTRGLLLDQGFNPSMNPQQTTPFFSYTPPQPATPNQVLSPQSTQRSQAYRQSPYPAQPTRMQPQQRSASISSTHNMTGFPTGVNDESKQDPQATADQRRVSIPTHSAPSMQQFSRGQMHSPISLAPSSMQDPGHLLSESYNSNAQPQQPFTSQFGFGFPQGMSTYDPMTQFQNPVDFNPLSPSLPPEAQQFLGSSAFDSTNDRYSAYMMNNSHGLPVPLHGINYSYNPNLSSPKERQNPVSDGMSQTLSQSPIVSMPSSRDVHSNHMSNSAYISSPHISAESAPTSHPSNFNYQQFGLITEELTKSTDGTHATSTPTNEYDSLINYQDDQDVA